MERRAPLTALNPHEARTAAALFERIFPADENGPGAEEIGAVAYVDRALAGVYRDRVEAYRLGLEALDCAAKERFGDYFADCGPEGQDALISDLEHGALPNFRVPPQREFFWMLREHAREGHFSDPAHGGNRDKMGWKVLGHPGVWLEHTAQENVATPSRRAARSGPSQIRDSLRTMRHASRLRSLATIPRRVWSPRRGRPTSCWSESAPWELWSLRSWPAQA